MRILLTTGLYPPDIGGPATYSKFLAENLPRFGHFVEVLSFGSVRKYWPVVRHAVFFFKVLSRARRADAIYAQDTFSVGLPSACANVFLRRKFLVRVPGDHVWEQGTARFGVSGPLDTFPLYGRNWPFILTVMRFLQQFVVKSAEALVVPSKYMKGIVSKWGVRAKSVVLIYNGVEELTNNGNKLVLRGLLKFQGKLILSAGRLVPWKGFSELIALMPRIRKEFPDAKLLVVGNGPMLSVLEAEAANLNLSDDVIFTGNLERDVLIRYVRASDVFVLNSRYEGLSHQLLEVMAIGVPAVASKVGGNVEVIEDNESGYLVKPGDTETLYKRVSLLLKDATMRAKIVASAKKRVKQFSEERMVEETAKLLSSI